MVRTAQRCSGRRADNPARPKMSGVVDIRARPGCVAARGHGRLLEASPTFARSTDVLIYAIKFTVCAVEVHFQRLHISSYFISLFRSRYLISHKISLPLSRSPEKRRNISHQIRVECQLTNFRMTTPAEAQIAVWRATVFAVL